MYTVLRQFIGVKNSLTRLGGVLILGMLMGILVILLLSFSNAINLNSKEYVYVDVEKVISSVNNEISRQIKEKKITDNDVSAKLVLAKNKFDQSLGAYVKKHNAIVFSSSKVIAGAIDLTEYFTKQTLEGLE